MAKRKTKKEREEARLAHRPLDVIPTGDRTERSEDSDEVRNHLAESRRREQNVKDYARRVQSARG